MTSIPPITQTRPTYDINNIVSTESELNKQAHERRVEDEQYRRIVGQERYDRERLDRILADIEARTAAMHKALQSLGSGPVGADRIALSLVSNAAQTNTTVNTTGQVNQLTLEGGDQNVQVRAGMVSSINTDGGNDVLHIVAGSVSGVNTERTVSPFASQDEKSDKYKWAGRQTVSNDSVTIEAQRADGIYTGGGDDTVNVQAQIVKSVYGGDGQDTLTVQAGIVSGIHGEAGDDTISVSAGIGVSALQHHGYLPGFGFMTTDDQPYIRAESAEDRLRQATTNYADVQGGAGNDHITVDVQEVLSVNGGSGDDVLEITGGTVGMRITGGANGDDTVRVAPGAEFVLQLDARAHYSIEYEGDDMVIQHQSGSVRIEGYAMAGAIAISSYTDESSADVQARELKSQKMHEYVQEQYRNARDNGSGVRELAVPEPGQPISEELAATRTAIFGQTLEESGFDHQLEGFKMLHIGPPPPPLDKLV